MKKLLLIIVLFAALGSQLIAQNIMSLSSAEGSSQDIVEIELYVTNIDDFIAFQTEIPLGDNLTYVENSAVLYRSEEHQLIASVVNGILKIYSYSFSSSAFSGNEGKVASFQLKLGNEPGNFVLENTKAKLVDVSAEELPLSTTNGNVKVITPKVQILTPELNFGHIPIRNTYTRSLTVKNIGNAPMTITGLLFSNESLSCPSFTEKVVSAGYSTSFTIQYAPQISGAVTYDITVVSDASSGNHKAKVIADPYSVNELHLDQTSGYCDSIIDYNISINNMDAITGFQFCVKMPTALQYQEGSIELSSRMNDHIGFASMRNDTLIVGAYSVTNASFTGNEGVIASLKIKIKGNSGYHYLHPNNVIITNADADNVMSDYYYGYVSVRAPRISANATHELSPSSVTESISSVYGIYNNGNAPLRIDSVKFNDDYLFTTTEFPLVINDYQSANLNISCNKDSEGEIKGTMRIYSNDPTTGLLVVKVLGSRYEPNELQIDNEDVTTLKYLDVLVNLDNYSELTAIQADFSFPNEYYTLSNSDVKLTERCSGFSKTAVAVNDSTFKILVFSMSNDIINGNEGAVLKIRLMRKDGAQNENATVSLKNIVLSDVKGNNKNSGGDKIKAIKLLSTHSKELKEGWNWYSTYIDIEGEEGLNMVLEALGGNAKQIKSHTEFATYYEDVELWDGSLKSIDNNSLYMIKISTPCTMTISGTLTDLSEFTYVLRPGWNWLGYPVTTEMSLNDIDLGFTPKDGDFIKSQTQFARYYEEYGCWDGSLTVLKPGEGYKYKNTDSSDKVLTYSLKKKSSKK